MIIEIGKIYGCDLNKETAQELALSLGKTLTSLGIVKGAIQLTLYSSNRSMSLPTHSAKGIQGITDCLSNYGLLGAVLSNTFIRDRSWGDGGMAEAVQQQFQLNRKDEFLKAFIQQAIASGSVKLNETIEHYRQ